MRGRPGVARGAADSPRGNWVERAHHQWDAQDPTRRERVGRAARARGAAAVRAAFAAAALALATRALALAFQSLVGDVSALMVLWTRSKRGSLSGSRASARAPQGGDSSGRVRSARRQLERHDRGAGRRSGRGARTRARAHRSARGTTDPPLGSGGGAARAGVERAGTGARNCVALARGRGSGKVTLSTILDMTGGIEVTCMYCRRRAWIGSVITTVGAPKWHAARAYLTGRVTLATCVRVPPTNG